jgi:serine/threonine protein kinase
VADAKKREADAKKQAERETEARVAAMREAQAREWARTKQQEAAVRSTAVAEGWMPMEEVLQAAAAAEAAQAPARAATEAQASGGGVGAMGHDSRHVAPEGKRGGKTRPGDWVCPKCGINNYAKRVNCFKCHNPRLLPESDARPRSAAQAQSLAQAQAQAQAQAPLTLAGILEEAVVGLSPPLTPPEPAMPGRGGRSGRGGGGRGGRGARGGGGGRGSPPSPPPTTMAPSTRMSYPYELLRKLTLEWADDKRLGSGGSGSVYHARIDGTPVAIKRFHSDGSSASAAWQTELQLLSQSVHPNVVPLFGSSSDGPAVCLVYHYCDGGSVEQRLAQQPASAGAPPPPPLSPAQRLIILSDVSRGLAHLHSIGVVHRDIKPANVLLQQVQSGISARIGDFGVARTMEAEALTIGSGTLMSRSRTFQGAQVAGTLVYMAPEYLKAAASTTKVDAFAFGLTLVVVLTGRLAEREVPPLRAGDEAHANLLEFFYDELQDDVGKLLGCLDPTCSTHGSAGAWEEYVPLVRELHGVATRCLEHRARQRAEIRSLIPQFENARATAEARAAAEAAHRQEFCCPLSLERMRDPVIASDGVTYEREKIEDWLAQKMRTGNVTSPVTGQPLTHAHLTPNLALKALIEGSPVPGGGTR